MKTASGIAEGLLIVILSPVILIILLYYFIRTILRGLGILFFAFTEAMQELRERIMP